jgi:hypothetical protein
MKDDNPAYADCLTSSSFPQHSPVHPGWLHLCASCGKPRSEKYHADHPLIPGQVPKPGVCSRPKCAQFKKMMQEDVNWSPALVVEVHHYYHTDSDFKPTNDSVHVAEVPGESSLAGQGE